tara:strand:- start:1681 stop:2199 length:519 start_codon:yes stop_codon:yes gene_type:complete
MAKNVSRKEFEKVLARLESVEAENKTLKKSAKTTPKSKGGKNLSKLSYRELQKQAKKQGIPANQTKAELISALSGNDEPTYEWETIHENIVKRNKRPVAYALIQKKGKKTRAVFGSYASIPESRVKVVKDYFIKTSWKDRKGNKVTGYLVPMSKGRVVLESTNEAETLLKGF